MIARLSFVSGLSKVYSFNDVLLLIVTFVACSVKQEFYVTMAQKEYKKVLKGLRNSFLGTFTNKFAVYMNQASCNISC